MNFKIDYNRISFFFCVPHFFWKQIVVNKKSKTGKVLNYILKEDKYSYIYNGCIIDVNLTFEDIGMIDGTTLFAFKKSENDINNDVLEIMKLSMDSYFDNRLKILSDKKTKEEQNRLSDIKYMKMEGNLNMYKKHSRKCFMKEKSERAVQIKSDLNIHYQPLSMPCSDAMPILW